MPSEQSPFRIYRTFFEGLVKSFSHLGVECSVLEGDGGNPSDLFAELLYNPPDCTFCFNGFIPDSKGRFFCDDIRIPHIACLLDPPTRFFSLLPSKYTIVTCIDRDFCGFYHGLQKGDMQVAPLFFPHAVSHDLHAAPENEREYEVVAMATCYDYEGERAKWCERYPQDIYKIMEEVIEITFSEAYASFIHVGIKLLDERKIMPDIEMIERIFYDLETYIKGRDRIEQIRAIQEECQVHIFGGAQKDVGWERYFAKGKSNVVLHAGVSLPEAIEVMKRSKVLLNACSTVKNGSHERVFLGLACGALVLASDNCYLREQFQEGSGVVFSPLKEREKVNSQVRGYLQDEPSRVAAVNKGYEIVKREHTWDSRVKMLQETLPALIEKIHS